MNESVEPAKETLFASLLLALHGTAMKFLCSSMSFSPMLVHHVLETLQIGSHVWKRSRWSLSCHIPEAC